MLDYLIRLFVKFNGSPLLGSALSLYIIQFSNYILPIVTIPYLVRILTPEGYGLAAYALSFAGILNVLLDYGFALTATRDIAASKNEIKRVHKIVSEVVFTKLLMTGATVLVFAVVVHAFPTTRSHTGVFWIALAGTLGNTFLPTWLFQGLEQLPRLAGITLVFRLSQIPLMFSFVRTKEDVFVWLLIVAITTLMGTGAVWLVAFRRQMAKLEWPGWIRIQNQLRQGFPVFLSQAAVTLYTTANTFILGTMTNLSIAGYYAAAERMVRTAFSLLAPINQILFPRASSLAGDSQQVVIPMIQKALMLVGSMGFVLSGFLFLFTDLIVRAVLGIEFLEAISVLRVMSVLPFLFALGAGLTLLVMLPFHLEARLLWVYALAGVINLMLVLILVPRYGGVGMAVAVVFAEVSVVLSQAKIALAGGVNLLSRRS